MSETKIRNHEHTFIYDKKAIFKISNQSDERCMRSCSYGKRLGGQKDGWNEGWTDAHTDR